jgi:type IV pilus assembly protein PilY1
MNLKNKNLVFKDDFIVKNLLKKIQVSTLAAAITSSICLATMPVNASDIEIYKVPEDVIGSTTLMFMLDVSGSMRTTDSGQTQTRLQLLKKGMEDVLLGSNGITPIEDKIIIGLADFDASNGRIRVPARSLDTVLTGTFSIKNHQYLYSKTGSTTTYRECVAWNPSKTCKTWSTSTLSSAPSLTGYTYEDCNFSGVSNCRIYFKSENVTNTQRYELVKAARNLTAYNGATPTAYAYAEVASYLMGTATLDGIYEPIGYLVDNAYKKCSSYQSGNITLDGYGVESDDRDIESDLGKKITVKKCTEVSSSDFPAPIATPLAPTDSTIGVMRYGVNAYVYYKLIPASLTTSAYSGWTSSVSSAKDGYNYAMPVSIRDQLTDRNKRECSGQGIYFLTDGEPNHGGSNTGANGKTGTAYQLMSSSLTTKAGFFSCANSELGGLGGYRYTMTHWGCIGNYAKTLLDSTKNPVGLKLKTAVVGFGNGFNGASTNSDVKDAKTWGELGGGGWYSGNDSAAVVNSVNKFIQELVKDIPSLSTGSSVIPVDALNPAVIQSYAYFPQFEPKVNPADTQQVWFGNLKKYYVVNNGVYASPTASDANLVVKNGALQDLADIWRSNLAYTDLDPVYSKHGVLGQLELGRDGETTKRNLLTDYKYNNGMRTKDAALVPIKYTYTSVNETKNDNKYSRQLMGLLGYDITPAMASDANLIGLNLKDVEANLRQMGAPLHSEPVLLTQSGRIQAVKNTTTNQIEMNTTGRKDYVLFGTTQGLVQVVDAQTGVEKIAFVPKEIIENQSEAFKNKGGNLVNGKNALYYGIDGEWTAHTNYVTDSNGAMTVGTVERAAYGSGDSNIISGHQWVYGGMRMGGRSYYALDLSDIDKPNLKLHIDPTTGNIYSYDPKTLTMTTKEFPDIKQMGQSWSKPVLGYVNWKGKRKLVMIVGGGYDAGGPNGDGNYANNIRTGYEGYEKYNYQQANSRGSGVYMFDADNGDLLWKASDINKADTKVSYLVNSDLKYSVVSEIKTVDRNNDGLIDHLYFGDLAGQGFRVDFANDAQVPVGNDLSKSAFKSQVNKILDVSVSAGLSPRFYLPPTFTAHSNAGKPNGANIVMAVFASGDKSSPLLGTIDSPAKQNPVGLTYNGVYAVYDYDAYNNNNGKYPYYDANHSLTGARSLAEANGAAAKNKLKSMNGRTQGSDPTLGAAVGSWGGWYYLFKRKMGEEDTEQGASDIGAGIIKALRPLISLENNLYVSQFDPTDNGTTTSCGAGVKGHTFAIRLCLPQGVCLDGAKYSYNLGSGDVKLNVGPGRASGTRELVVMDPSKIGGAGQACTGPGCGGSFIAAGGPIKFIPNKWYEKYSRVGAGE